MNDHRQVRTRSHDHITAKPTVTRQRPPELALQRAAGNRAVTSLVTGVQAKLAVGSIADPQEQDADAVAAAVVRSIRTGSLAGEDTPTPPHLQRKAPPAAARISALLDAPTEQAITNATGGVPLQATVRRTMEQAFGGVDFGAVRIHAGHQAADLNGRLGARAFTVGTDIFFRDGVPGETDPLLAHELTHVVQQGGASAVERRLPAQRSVQFKKTKGSKAILGKVYGYGYDLDSKGLVDTNAKRVKFEIGTKLTLAKVDPKRGKTQKPKEDPGFVQIATPGPLKGKWVSIDSLDLRAPDDKSSKLGDALEWAEMATDAYGAQGETMGVLWHQGDLDRLHDRRTGAITIDQDTKSDTSGLTYDAKGMSAATTAGDVAGMVLALGTLIHTIRDKETSKLDVAGATADFGASMVGAAGGVALTVKEFHRSLDGVESTAAILGSVATGYEGVKALVKVTRTLVEAGKAHHESTVQDKLHTTGEVISGLLEATKSAVSVVKLFLDQFDTAAGAAVANAVPGLGIAIGAVDFAVRAVDIVSGSVHAYRMRNDKRAAKELIGGVKGKKFKHEANAIVAKVEEKMLAGEHITDDAELRRYQDAREYLMARGIEYINEKRIRRAFLKLSITGLKIAADATTLSGIASGAGVGLKVGAVAVDVGSGLFRRLKQMGRDYRAKNELKDPDYKPNWLVKMFNAKKSTTAKEEEYNRTVDQIFDMIVRASTASEPKKAAKKVARYVEAMGMSVSRLYALRSTPTKLRKAMIEAMKKRE